MSLSRRWSSQPRSPPAAHAAHPPSSPPRRRRSAPKPCGGTLTVGLYQEPDNLNPFLAAQTASRLVRELVLEGLVDAGPANSYRPQLATVVPTVKNGGISKNGLRVTYRLRPNLKWSDGHPLTSADVKFTWQSVMNKANKVNSQAGYDQIKSVSTPNRTTVVVTFK